MTNSNPTPFVEPLLTGAMYSLIRELQEVKKLLAEAEERVCRIDGCSMFGQESPAPFVQETPHVMEIASKVSEEIRFVREQALLLRNRLQCLV